jgi:hypothetical protein
MRDGRSRMRKRIRATGLVPCHDVDGVDQPGRDVRRGGFETRPYNCRGSGMTLE